MILYEWRAVEFGRNAENEPEAGANAEGAPWIEVGEEDMVGRPSGCNEVSIEYSIEGNAMSFAHAWTELKACHLSDLDEVFWLWQPKRS